MGAKMAALCQKCNKEFHPSNLIAGMFCFPCYKKVLRSAKRGTKILGFFASFYLITPIIAGIVSLLIILAGLSWLLTLYAAIWIFISLIGAFPHMHGVMTPKKVEETERNYEDQLQKYIPGKISYCHYHPTREAIGRCGMCIKPFCTEDFYFQRIRIPKGPYRSYSFEQPAYCLKCGDDFKNNIKISPILFTLLSVGIFLFFELFYPDSSLYTIVVLIPLFICVVALPLGFLYLRGKLYRKSF